MEPLSPHDPRNLGEFQLRARLGSGGMGRVYLGYSPAGRAVAVKVVHPELAGDSEFSRRFAREVDAAKAVSGMYTAPVVAAGPDDDPPWLATAFVPGPSLAELVDKHGPLPAPAVWRLAAGVAEALRAVHACGLVHRDLKPANVLLALDGPHLIDFGISRALDAVSLTKTGMVMGTPGYMAPEQAEGHPTGPPSDVFSLGALLAFALTGKAPFGHGSAAAVLYRVVSGEPDLDGVPPDVRGLVTACMAKDPGRRPDLPALAGMIAKHGPGSAASVAASVSASFWPADVAGFIRASQPDLEQAQDRTLAAAEAVSAAKPARDGKTRLAGNGAPGMPEYAPRGGTAVPGRAAGNGARPPGHGARDGAAGNGARPRQGAGSLPAPGYGQYPAGMPGYPQPAAPGQNAPYGPYGPYSPYRQYTPPRLAPMVGASWLMRLGAAVSFVNAIVTLASIQQIKASALARHPMVSAAAARAMASGAAGAAVAGAFVGIALWLWLASAARRGRRWVRPAGTALFGAYTLGVLSTIKNPGITATKDLGIVLWVIGLLAVIAMWARRAR